MLKYARYLLGALVFFGGSLVLILLAIFRPFDPKMALLWSRWVPRLGNKIMGIKIEVRNQERMHASHPCIFIANHQHALDLYTHGGVQQVPMVAIGKKEVLYVPFFGQIFWLTGMIFIDRKNHHSAIETMNDVARQVRERHVSVWMFPEGTRSHGRGLLPFKRGPFHLAIANQVPIVPVVASSYRHLNFNKWNAGKVVIQFLEPISTVGKVTADIDSLIEVAHSRMKEKIEELNKELS
jgi:1-acyl-sn-glycerol-3-phosphate acyltransferase